MDDNQPLYKYLQDISNNTSVNSSTIQSLLNIVKNINNNIGSLKNQIQLDKNNFEQRAILKPLNIFPNYWVDSTHQDFHIFNVPVEKGKRYWLSATIANNPSGVAIRASSSWNIADQWGDIIPDDGGATNVGQTYQIGFTAPKTGNMPIQFIHTKESAASKAPALMLKQITMTQSIDSVPYSMCANYKQSIDDVTGDAGMDAKAMFGTL